MPSVKAYAAQSATSGLAPWSLERRALRPDDVHVDILFCGVCHSDIHAAENDWGRTNYPIVPGHEVVGRVTAIGDAVTKHAVGDIVGIGPMCDSCRSCAACDDGVEQYCLNGMTAVYNAADRHDGSRTYGGYSTAIVVSEHFAVKMPEGLDLAAAAPLLCAGITTYSPLRHYGVSKGSRVGVVGMGGLGHMGIKLARALGAEVTLFTRSAAKVEEARRNGAHEVVVSTEPGAMEAMAGRLDFILDTVPVAHDLNPYLDALTFDGTYILVGQLVPLDPPVDAAKVVYKRRRLVGSLIGGIAETEELLALCAEKGITCDVEVVRMQDIATAFERTKKGDVRYRFVIDMASLKEGGA